MVWYSWREGERPGDHPFSGERRGGRQRGRRSCAIDMGPRKIVQVRDVTERGFLAEVNQAT
jgi:hypothetical protein